MPEDPLVMEALRSWAQGYKARHGRPPMVHEWEKAKAVGPKVNGEIEVMDEIDPDAPVVEGELQ